MKLFLVWLIPAALFAQSGSALQQGRALFRSNCAFCHGMTASGGRGPNLVSAPLSHGDTDQAIERVIHDGVPGTTMPSFSEFTSEEAAQIVEYLRNLSKNVPRQENITGDPAKGRAIYKSDGCIGCHRIGAEGSVFGPDLSRIGAARSIGYLRESITNPSADIPEEYEGVTAVLKSGQSIRRIRINEDTFTLQLRDASQKIRMFDKSDLSEVIHEKQSLMPPYSKLAAVDLDDLVAYLASLRGAIDRTAPTGTAKGIK